MKSLKEFRDQFRFDPEKKLHLGVERECFLLNSDGNIAPISQRVLNGLVSCNGQFAHEFSACQFEWRAGPCKDTTSLRSELKEAEIILGRAEKRLDFKRSFYEVAPPNMPLDISPDPRYKRIARSYSQEAVRAMCRIIATHIHVGMPDHETALRAYNNALKYFDRLCEMGDHSNGKRLAFYSTIVPNYKSSHYGSWRDFFREAKCGGFVDDPGKCWALIRISKHGTIEFRMFGTTKDINEIVEWASFCRKICQEVIRGE